MKSSQKHHTDPNYQATGPTQTPQKMTLKKMKKTYLDHHNRIMAMSSTAQNGAYSHHSVPYGKRAPSVLTTVTTATSAGETVTRHPSPDRISVGVMADLADLEAQMLLSESHNLGVSDKDYSPLPQLLMHECADDDYILPAGHHSVSLHGIDIGVGTNFNDFDGIPLHGGDFRSNPMLALGKAAAEANLKDESLLSVMSIVANGLASPPMETYYGSYSATPRHHKTEDDQSPSAAEQSSNHIAREDSEESLMTPEVADLLFRQNTAPCQSIHSSDAATIRLRQLTNLSCLADGDPITDLMIDTDEGPYSPGASILTSCKLDASSPSANSIQPTVGDTITSSQGQSSFSEVPPAIASCTTAAAMPAEAPLRAEEGSALSINPVLFDNLTSAPLPAAFYHHPEFFYTYLESESCDDESDGEEASSPFTIDNVFRGQAVANVLTSYYPNANHRSKSPADPLVEAAQQVTNPKLVSFTQVVYALAILKRLGKSEEELKNGTLEASSEEYFYSSPPSHSAFFGPASARRALGAAMLIAGKVHEDRYPRASAIAAAIGLKMKKESECTTPNCVEAEKSSLDQLSRSEELILDKLRWSVHVTVGEYQQVYTELMDALRAVEQE
eukprot:GILJ01015213.1.p1 GENE.GILJ01015213.1~~GILJ01015213.1.p1  ORF type:complete len:616 (+),score=93.11 GILJ01015213.1:224-2071(+)